MEYGEGFVTQTATVRGGGASSPCSRTVAESLNLRSALALAASMGWTVDELYEPGLRRVLANMRAMSPAGRAALVVVSETFAGRFPARRSAGD